ncbi:hypothetical protein Q7P37_011085 [Cladosporium fusiforme]
MASGEGDWSTEDAEGFVFKLYRYTPSLPAAVVAVVVFAILTAIHAWRMQQAKAYYFTPFLIGGICKLVCLHHVFKDAPTDTSTPVQVIGYAGRIWSHFDEESIGGFVMQAILILIAPALYAASIYMILARLIRAVHAEHLSLIPIKWVTKIFVTGDVFAFTLQAGGGGVQSAGTLDLYELGEKVIIAGLFVQIAIFGFFVVTSVLFHSRFVSSGMSSTTQTIVPWKRHLIVLYTTSGLILVRSIFRVIEYLQGNGGYLISHEVFLYIFDAVLMAITMAIFCVWYIGDLDPKKNHRSINSTDSGNFIMTEQSHPGKIEQHSHV